MDTATRVQTAMVELCSIFLLSYLFPTVTFNAAFHYNSAGISSNNKHKQMRAKLTESSKITKQSV